MLQNGLVGVVIVDCRSLQICSELVQDLSSIVYWSKTQHGISSFVVKSEHPAEIAKEVFDFMPDLVQLNTESFNVSFINLIILVGTGKFLCIHL